MKYRIFTFVVFIFLICGHPLQAQVTGTITGKVTNLENGIGLEDVNIYLQYSVYGAASNNRGEFTIREVPPGSYMLIAEILGYQTVQRDIVVLPGATIEIDMQLRPVTFRLNEIVTTATLNRELITSVPAASEVLNRKELQELNADDVGQALQSITGGLVKQYGPLGSLETPSLRGSGDNQVLVLMDGQRLNDAQSASVDMGLLPLSAVEKIEVVKGGYSGLYGSEAIGGVINIMTRKHEGKNRLKYSTTGTTGSFGTSIYDVSLGQSISNFDYLAAYHYAGADNDFKFDSAGVQQTMRNADFASDNVFASAGYTFPNQSRLSGFYQYYSGERGSPGSLDFPTSAARLESQRQHASLAYRNLSFRRFSLNTDAYFIESESNYNSGQLLQNNHLNRTIGAHVTGYADFDRLGLFTYGYEFRRNQLESWNYENNQPVLSIGEQERDVHSLFMQNDWSYQFNPEVSLTVIPSARLDHYSETVIEDQLTPRIGGMLSFSGDWTGAVRGNLGRVFRAPTFNDLYWPDEQYVRGNPALKPEEGIAYDAGFIANFKSAFYWGIEVTAFATHMDNLILWDLNSNGVYMPRNVASAYNRGIEGRITFDDLQNRGSVQLGYTYLKATDQSGNSSVNGNFLPYRPEHKIDAGFTYRFRETAFHLSYIYVGERFTNLENSKRLNSYSLLNFNAGLYPELWGATWTLRLEINNLTDEDIQIIHQYPYPGREFRLVLGVSGSVLNSAIF
ncbi:MAG: TonB-dependent receptor [Calditrichia bacterium]